MKIRFTKLSCSVVALSCALILCGCNSSSPPPDAAPPATPTKTEAPAQTETPEPAIEAGAPQRKPPAGKGNAIGRVLFNGKGAANVEVQLCEKLGFIGGCDGKTYQGKTDKNGFYVIDNVAPGEYALAVRVFNTNKYIYPTSGIISAAKFEIEKDQTLAVRTVNLWKSDLQIEAPKKGATVNVGKPKFSWKAYPDAANYKITVREKSGSSTVLDAETSETSVVSEKSLLNGEYQWKVEAFNADGTKLAEPPSDSAFKITGQSGSNTVELLNPKLNASVSGKNLTLQWKAHPQADAYKVYLRGVKADDAIISFESVSGTSYKVSQSLSADQYFWSVQADKAGEKVAASPLQSFNVK